MPTNDGGLQPYNVLPATATDPDREAVWCDGHSLTWRQLEQRSRQLAQGLRAEGVGEGDAWGILARNDRAWAELTIGNGRCGARYVPLNWHLTVAEVADLLVDSEAKLLVVDADLAATGKEAAAAAGVDRVIVLGPDYEDWLGTQSDQPLPDCKAGAPLQYTGGTTGRSKGVTRSDQAGKASDLRRFGQAWGDLVHMPENERIMLSTPAYHALGGGVLRAALSRGNNVTIIGKWDPEGLLGIIERRRITGTAMVPTQFIRLLKLDQSVREGYDVSSLEWVLHTAAPCPAWVKRDMIDWFGPVIVELYGSSEGVGPVIATSDEWLANPGTVGRASKVLELSIIDDDGNDLPAGEVGTIYVKRLDGTPAYYGDKEKTEAMVRPDGRFTVGDVGWLNDDGYLFLADRRVDLIISGGSNIYPAEIEAVLSEHPAVADVAVFGIANDEWGQEVKAVVETVDGAAVDEVGLLGFARERLASFKVPKSVDFADSLPREASGKLKKHKLKAAYDNA